LSGETDSAKCAPRNIENAGKWLICHPDAQSPPTDVTANLNLPVPPLIPATIFSNKGAANGGGERVLE
jgi:hypothetical protein